jgi:hypothetical protein
MYRVGFAVFALFMHVSCDGRTITTVNSSIGASNRRPGGFQ